VLKDNEQRCSNGNVESRRIIDSILAEKGRVWIFSENQTRISKTYTISLLSLPIKLEI
tara:strand:- start:390 stop:563 length:174 start_codon:yes stop_codon:yes gene_type:complete